MPAARLDVKEALGNMFEMTIGARTSQLESYEPFLSFWA